VTREPLVLSNADVSELLTMEQCIAAVEETLRAHALGQTIAPGMLGAHVEHGGFHVKTAGIRGERSRFVAKVNANFPRNPATFGLPTIQGVLTLFDADDGRVLAIMDSTLITCVRTAATSAIAAKYASAAGANRLAIVGCGEQGRSHLRAMRCVRPISQVMVHDLRPEIARDFQREMSAETQVPIEVMTSLDAVREADIVVTCTTSNRWFLSRAHVSPGTFIAAVGADNPLKHEIEPELIASSVVITDSTEQAATIGDLHHALKKGIAGRDIVRGELHEVIAGRMQVRREAHEITVFDSTGTALQDLGAASGVYDRAMQREISRIH
jgi:alanine dehydrogenase